MVLLAIKHGGAALRRNEKEFFPENVGYFVSYYDYYQPESVCAKFERVYRKGNFGKRTY